jgi:hypothetical protein
MGMYGNYGTVFTAATCEWPRIVGKNIEPRITQITKNVLDTLSSLDAVDVTAISGTTVVGPLTSWQTPDGPFLVEHLAGVDANGNGIVFFWSPRADWQAVNVSAISGLTLSAGAALTSWQTSDGPFLVEHLAGVDANGNAIVFFWSSRADWQAVNVSAISGLTLSAGAALTSWQTPDGPNLVEHLAGVDTNGNVIVFFWSPRADWQAVDVSAISGTTLAAGAPLTSWQTPDGPLVVEHLAGVDANGDVIVFFWSPRADWQAVNVSAISSTTLAAGAALTSWQTPDGPFLVEHLAGVDANGNVIAFFWSPRADWQAVNISTISGVTLAARDALVSWQLPKPGLRHLLQVEKLAGVASDGSAYVFSWSSASDWTAFNLSQFTKVVFAQPLTSWHVPDGPLTAEHIAAIGPSGRLELVYWKSE